MTFFFNIDFLCEVGEDLNLSEKGFKRALWSRLTSEQREAFDSYREQALKEAISSLVCHFDNPLKSYHYHDLITQFTRRCFQTYYNLWMLGGYPSLLADFG